VNIDLAALEDWDRRILEKVDAYGLDCFAQDFEICDHEEMIGYMAYSGMPSRYSHWSFGKSFERLKTLYHYGVQGLPYEMVINADPALAYLMGDNSLCLNVLTMAHVYGHNDFFKNNFGFSQTRPEFTLATFKSHATRVRSYLEDPSIGVGRVEPLLDAAHALSLQCRRNLFVRKMRPAEQVESVYEASQPRRDPYSNIHTKSEYVEPDLRKVPLQPEEDLLLFVRDYNPFLADWQRDLLTIVAEETRYFLPQIETKIMNEGWASFFHYHIMSNLDLPQALAIEFMIHHNAVIRPAPGGLNPYHIGFKVWDAIYRSHEGDGPIDLSKDNEGRRAIYAARECERDSSFLRRFLTERLARELGLFEFTDRRGERVVSEVADEDGWEAIKNSLVRSVGMGSIPIIKVVDADHRGARVLLLEHDFEGRELKLADAEKTLAYVYQLWGREVDLKTVVGGRPTLLIFNDQGFSTKSPS